MALGQVDLCALCRDRAELCDSHIVPEFCYRSMYDDKHRAVTFSPLDPERQRYAQNGIRSRLLCARCECLINDNYEKPFLRYWIEGDVLQPLGKERIHVLKGVDYPSFKLFHLSVLYRASASDDPNFAEVQLRPQHEERIREMLLNRDPGEHWRYPIIASAIQGSGGRVWDSLVAPAHQIRLDGHWGYMFVFAGCQWTYLVSSHPTVEYSTVALAQDGTLPVAKFPLKAIELYESMRRSRARQRGPAR